MRRGHWVFEYLAADDEFKYGWMDGLFVSFLLLDGF